MGYENKLLFRYRLLRQVPSLETLFTSTRTGTLDTVLPSQHPRSETTFPTEGSIPYKILVSSGFNFAKKWENSRPAPSDVVLRFSTLPIINISPHPDTSVEAYDCRQTGIFRYCLSTFKVLIWPQQKGASQMKKITRITEEIWNTFNIWEGPNN